jgi:REP element-mobilizing transposase RayT
MADHPPQPLASFDWTQARLTHRDRLPHVRQEDVIYFVTFRLNDSLPAERTAELRQQRDAWMKFNPPPHTPEQEREYRRIWTVRIENLMDAGWGQCVLRGTVCREMLETSMRHDEGSAYRLGPYVIMPNHVHALLRMLPGHELGDAMKAWKSVSARRIGKRLGRTGSFWTQEYFDHAVRSDESLARIVSYIRENPRNLAAGTFTVGCGSLEIEDFRQ